MRSVAAIPLAGLTLLAFGCRPPLPDAPTELDDLAHFFFDEMDNNDPSLVGAGAENLDRWFDTTDEVEDGWATGGVSDLSTAQVDSLEAMTWDPDPTLAVGVYIATVVDCSLARVVEITLEPDQLTLFPGNYDSYERTFDSDPDCFPDGGCDQVDWHSELEDSIVGLAMSYGLVTRFRRFGYEDAEGEATQVLLARNVMPAAAEENVTAGGFEQSYHIEVFVPRGAGQTLHLYALWNHGFLDGVSEEAPFWENQYKDGLVEWDERIQELCTEAL